MSKKDARRARAIAQILAMLGKTVRGVRESKRDDALRAQQKKLLDARLDEVAFEKATRPTIEEKLAQLKEEEEYRKKSRAIDLAQGAVNLRQDVEGKRPSMKTIAGELGLKDEDVFGAQRELFGAGEDPEKAIAAIRAAQKKAPFEGSDDPNDPMGGIDPREKTLLLLERWKQQTGGRRAGGVTRETTGAAVDATNMKTVMDAYPMALNPNAPMEDQVRAWGILEKATGVKAPLPIQDFIRYGPPQGVGDPNQPMGQPPRAPGPADAARDRIQDWAPRPRRQTMEGTDWTTGELRGMERMQQPPNPYQSFQPKRTARSMGIPPQVAGAPFGRAEDQFLKSQQAQTPPTDPIDDLMQRVRRLRENTRLGRDPLEEAFTPGRYERGKGF